MSEAMKKAEEQVLKDFPYPTMNDAAEDLWREVVRLTAEKSALEARLRKVEEEVMREEQMPSGRGGVEFVRFALDLAENKLKRILSIVKGKD